MDRSQIIGTAYWIIHRQSTAEARAWRAQLANATAADFPEVLQKCARYIDHLRQNEWDNQPLGRWDNLLRQVAI